MRLIPLFLLSGMFVLHSMVSMANNDTGIENAAIVLHHQILTLDSHTDTPLMFGRHGYDIASWNDPRNRGGKVDFPRMKAGGLDAVFFAVFVGQGERTADGNAIAKQRALDIFNNIDVMLAENHEVAELAVEPDDAYRLKKAGKHAIYIGLENAYPIGNDLAMVKEFYDLGVRYITLSHTRNNDVCDASTDEPEHNGLSDFGKKLVKEMNRIGMMIDVSHISDQAFYDVLEITSVPVIASHSSARAICDNPRNLDDEMLLALQKNGGVVQVCILSEYVKKMKPNPERDSARMALREKFNNFQGLTDDEMNLAREAWYEVNRLFPPELATVSDIVDHIDHIVRLIGIDYVGIGTDFDGGGALSDCYDVSELPNITIELMKRGYSDEEIEKIWSGNFMRVFRQVVAAKEG
jgi:membrane dipeptidase